MLESVGMDVDAVIEEIPLSSVVLNKGDINPPVLEEDGSIAVLAIGIEESTLEASVIAVNIEVGVIVGSDTSAGLEAGACVLDIRVLSGRDDIINGDDDADSITSPRLEVDCLGETEK